MVLMRNLKEPQKKQQPKSFEVGFDELSSCIVLKIVDTKGMYPFLLQDPEAGVYKVIKTRSGGLQMVK